MKNQTKTIKSSLFVHYTLMFVLTTLLLNSCGLFNRGTILKQYKKAAYLDCNKDSTDSRCKDKQFVQMGLFSSTEIGEEEKEIPKTIWNLKGEGQAMLIEKLNDRYKENDAFKKELDNKYLQEEETSDFTIKKVRLVISIKKLIDNNPKSSTYSLADRIQNLTFKISFKDAGATFLKWNKFETEYGEIDLGDITYERNAEATLGAGNEETLGNAEVKGGISRSEEVKLKKNYAKLNGIFYKDSLVVYLQGTKEVDLDGNIIIETTIKFREKKGYFVDLSNLKNSKGQYLPMDSIKTTFHIKKIPEYSDSLPLTIAFDYNYTYRHVTKNAKTYDESDDKVTFIDGAGKNTAVTLLNDDEIFPDRYAIFSDVEDTDPITLYNPDPLHVKQGEKVIKEGCGSKPSNIALWFPTEEKAWEFYEWLRYWGKIKMSSDKTTIRIGCYELMWADKPFTYYTAHIFDFAEIRKL